MSKHTQGRLRIGTKYATDIYADRVGRAIARTVNPQATDEDEENARRIVACWNAFDEVATEDVEKYTSLALFMKHHDFVLSQRDGLLETLRLAYDHINGGAGIKSGMEFGKMHSKIKQAIDKATGKM